MATIITKNSSTASSVPLAAQLVQGELAVNVTDKRLFTENSGGTVVELGTNPSSLSTGALAYTGTLTGGTGVVNLGSGQVYKDASGNVGVGVTSPHSLLSVTPGTFGANSNTVGCSFSVDSTGASQPISGFRWTGASAGLGSTYATQWVSDSANSLSTEMYTTGATPLVFGTNSLERARIDSSGNVGIGTSSPSDKLHVVAATNQGGVRVSGSVDNVALNLSNSGTSGKTWGIYSTNTNSGAGGGALAFFDGTAYRAIIDSSGNLLVGETAVDSSGGFAVVPSTSASGAPAILAFNKGNSASETCLRFKFQGTQVGSIAYSNTATTYATSSDYRLKEAITPMTGALAKVALLKPCTYKWKVDGSDGQGFIAHELAEVEAGCVTGEKDAVDADGNPQYQGIDTSFLVATLTAAIQEQQTLITALTARITALEQA